MIYSDASIRISYRIGSSGLGNQSVHYGVENLTGDELEVVVAKEIYAGTRLVERKEDRLMLDPYETKEGGTFFGDDIFALSDEYFFGEDLRPGECINRLAVGGRTYNLSEARRAAEAEREREDRAARERRADEEARAQEVAALLAEQERIEAEREVRAAEAEAEREARARAADEAEAQARREAEERAREEEAVRRREELVEERRKAHEEHIRELEEVETRQQEAFGQAAAGLMTVGEEAAVTGERATSSGLGLHARAGAGLGLQYFPIWKDNTFESYIEDDASEQFSNIFPAVGLGGGLEFGLFPLDSDVVSAGAVARGMLAGMAVTDGAMTAMASYGVVGDAGGALHLGWRPVARLVLDARYGRRFGGVTDSNSSFAGGGTGSGSAAYNFARAGYGVELCFDRWGGCSATGSISLVLDTLPYGEGAAWFDGPFTRPHVRDSAKVIRVTGRENNVFFFEAELALPGYPTAGDPKYDIKKDKPQTALFIMVGVAVDWFSGRYF